MNWSNVVSYLTGRTHNRSNNHNDHIEQEEEQADNGKRQRIKTNSTVNSTNRLVEQKIQIQNELVDLEDFRIYYTYWTQHAWSIKKTRNADAQRRLVELDLLKSSHLLDYSNRYTVDQINLEQLKERAQHDFYQVNVMQGIFTITQGLLQDNINGNNNVLPHERAHQIFSSLRLLSSGVHGYAFRVQIRDQATPFVIKTNKNPKDDDDLLHEEAAGLLVLNYLRSRVPNFSYVFGGFHCVYPTIDPNGKVQFCTDNKNQSIMQYVLYESVPGRSWTDWLTSPSVNEFVQNYLQVMYALAIAHREADFTHYDLHTSNVIMRPMDHLIAVPIPTEKGREEYIVTDTIPTIIDYGSCHYYLDGHHLGKNGMQEFGMQSDTSFPLFDAYKLLCSSARVVSIRLENKFLSNETRDRLNQLYKAHATILEFFTLDPLDMVILEQYPALFGLPRLDHLLTVSLYDLTTYIRRRFVNLPIRDIMPSDVPILRCYSHCLSVQDTINTLAQSNQHR